MPTEHNQPQNNELSNSPDKKRNRIDTSASKSIQISQDINNGHLPTSSQFSSNSHESVPLWTAGSSPAKFVSLEELIKMNDSIQKMAIVHQIAIDPKCKVEDLKAKDPIFEQVKTNMHNAYWELLRQDLLTKESPQFEHAFLLLNDLKMMIREHLETGNLKNALSAVDEALDLDYLRHLLQRGLLNLSDVLGTVLAILEKLCAPIRDELVEKLKREKDIIQLFRGIFNLVEMMRLDMANFTLSQNRQLIGSYSAKIEFDEFTNLLKIDISAADGTRSWMRKILIEFLEREQQDSIDELSHANINQLILQFYIQLLLTKNPQIFPETLKLDQAKIAALSEKFLQLELVTAAIFVTSNFVGKTICEGRSGFKAELKRDLLVILNDLDWGNYIGKLKNVALQCEKKYRDIVDAKEWKEDRIEMLKQQLSALANQEEPIRTIARNRIRDFMLHALQQSNEPLRIPPGMSVIQTELASLTSHFYAIAVHNWNAFGRFYAQILEEEFKQIKTLQSKN